MNFAFDMLNWNKATPVKVTQTQKLPPALRVDKTKRFKPKVLLVTHLKQFPDYDLQDRNGELFCSLCFVSLIMKKSTIKGHLKLETHQGNE